MKTFFCTLFLMTASYSLSQLVSDFKVNDDLTNRGQLEARIGVGSLGDFIVVWEDYRNNNPNVFAQRFNYSGHFIGTNFRVNVNPDSIHAPSIAISLNGSFAVCWYEVNSTVNFSSKIKCRLYDASVIPITGEILINDVIENFDSSPCIATTLSNDYIIVWRQRGKRGILIQKIDSIGNKIGFNQTVHDGSLSHHYGNPDISIKKDHSFTIVWSDDRQPSSLNKDDIYFQLFDQYGVKVGKNEKVNDDNSPNNLQHSPKIFSDSLGRFLISWNDDRFGISTGEIFAQRFSSTGNGLNNNFRVSLSSIGIIKGLRAVSGKPEGKYVVCWNEFVGPWWPYFQRLDSNGGFIGNNFQVTDQAPFTEKFYGDAKVVNDRIISVWSDSRSGNKDIYCNIRFFTNPDTTVNIIQISSLVPENFFLYQNFPNPFNSTTIIKFDIANSDFFKLDVYNELGQLVRRLLEDNLKVGSYKLSFHPVNLSSGIYFYSLYSNNQKMVKKFILLK